MSGDARGFPSSEFLMDSNPGAKRVSGSLDLFIDGFLEEFPSNLSYTLVSVEKFLENLGSGDTKEVAPSLVPQNVVGKKVLVPWFPEVSRASRLSQESVYFEGSFFGVVVFKVGDPQGGRSSSEVSRSALLNSKWR